MFLMLVKEDLEEKELVSRLKAGDVGAFHELYNRYKRVLTTKLLYLLKCEDLAADALQEVFLKVWQKRADIKEDLSFAAFLATMSKNLVYDMYRKSSRNDHLKMQIMQDSATVYDLEKELNRKENVLILKEALELLPERQREVLVMHKIDGHSYNEISEALGISHSAINQHIYRAMKQLSKILTPHIFIYFLLF